MESKLDIISAKLYELFPSDANEISALFDFSKIDSFNQFLERENFRGGFFSKRDTENILERHLIESIYHVYRITKEYPVSRETKLADVGTGPGLPGFLFYCLRESPEVTLIDAQRRKLGLLEEFAVKSGFRGLNFIYNRAEDISGKKFSLVITRSSVTFPWSAEICIKLINEGGLFVPFLGKYVRKKEDEEFLENLGLQIEKSILLDALNFLGTRHLIFLKKVTKTKQGYPRSWKIIKEEMRHNGEDRLD